MPSVSMHYLSRDAARVLWSLRLEGRDEDYGLKTVGKFKQCGAACGQIEQIRAEMGDSLATAEEILNGVGLQFAQRQITLF